MYVKAKAVQLKSSRDDYGDSHTAQVGMRLRYALLGGIVLAAEQLGTSKTLIGKCCQLGEVYALELALQLARHARPDDSIAQLAWCESVSPNRRAA